MRTALVAEQPVIDTLPASWLTLRTPAADGAWNMACDSVLMGIARQQGVGILRVYEWTRPTVSFGRHERTAGLYSEAELRAAGLDAVRRPTGGRALLHANEVTYSVTMPISDGVRWSAAYDALNERLRRAMLSLDIPARIVPAPDQRTPGEPANGSFDAAQVCFSGIAPGELAVGDRKLVASAVWRERGAYLQHGSILIRDQQSRLSGLLLDRGVAPPEPAATLAEWLPEEVLSGDVTGVVQTALIAAMADCGNVVPWSIPNEALSEIDVARLQLAQSDWLWRR